jgi:penicillin-binding protein 1A
MAADPPASPDPAHEVDYKFQLDQTPDIEGAIALVDPNSGKVLAEIGGYSYQRSQFNRVTQSLRQPGSAFKPVVYLAAVDAYKYTPATIVYDTPRTFRVGDEFWTPGNFDSKYLGPITLRVALEKSRNLVSADIVSRIGVDAPIRYAHKLGFTSRLGRNLSLSLGSSEVTLLELVRAYGVFAAKGILFDTVYVTQIKDRQGNVVYEYEDAKLTKAKQAISEDTAFVMANMMRGVVEHGTAYKVREIGRPVAGKTGTSNDQMDTWFIGYTPNLVAGVWAGFDVKKEIGDKETGGKVSAPIWLSFMRNYLNYLDKSNNDKLAEDARAEAERLGIQYVPPEKLGPLDFTPTEGVEGAWVDKASGHLTSANAPGAIYEYFLKGTAPQRGAEHDYSEDYSEESGESSSEGGEEPAPRDEKSYLESPDL